jgi:hypothetical protein
MQQLALKFPSIKFVKSVSTTCIPNYPDKNLPTIFVYYENQLMHNIVGPLAFNGMSLKMDDLEWKLHRLGVLKSTLNRDEKKDFENDNTNLRKCEEQMVKTIRESIMRKKDDDSDSD